MLDLTTCHSCGTTTAPGLTGQPVCGCTFAPAPPAVEFVAVAVTPAPAAALPFHLRSSAPPPVAAAAQDTGRGWGIREAAPGPGVQWDGAVRPPAPTPPPQAATMAPPPPAAPTSPHGSAGRLAVRVGVVASAAAVISVVILAGTSRAGFGALLGSSPTLSQPAAIGALTRITTPETAAVTRAVQAGFAGRSVQVVSGVYGRGGVPQVVFVGTRGSGTATNTGQLLSSINASTTPYTGAPVVASADGQEYSCGAVAGRSFGKAAVLCAWADHGINGFLLATGSDVVAALRLAEAARAASEG